jgi:5,10-methylenetetrahydromethanopterin reductase
MTPSSPLPEVVESIKRAEVKGFDIAWVSDSQLLWRDCYATMALAAAQTEKITLASGVSTPTRHTTVLAQAASSVAEMAPGRFILGFGSGESAVKLIGRRPSNLAELRAEIGTLRTLFDGDFVQYGDHSVRLRCSVGQLPIYLAASGPKTTRLAGEIADGAISLGGSVPDLITRARSELVAGFEAAGRTGPLPELVVGTFCKITDDIERDARLLKPICFYIATNPGGREYLESIGINIGVPELPKDLYPDMVHAEDWELAIQYAEQRVTDEMAVRFAETFGLVGTVDEIVGRAIRAIDAGATTFYFRHFMAYSLPDELIETFGDEILPRVRARLAERERAETSAPGWSDTVESSESS